MKKTHLSLIFGVASLSVAICTCATYIHNNLQPQQFALPADFTITAHTGCENAEDNSLESIRKGASAKADIVEIDLNFLKDGSPVLFHDAPDKAKNPVTLDEAFELLSSLDVMMNVDVKSTANLAAVVTLAEKHNVKDKIFFTGIEEKDVAAVRANAPSIPYYLNVKIDKKKSADPQYIASLIEKVKSNGAIGINANFKSCSAELVSAFRRENLPVSLWTANSKNDMYRCLKLAPDNITTRKPSLLKNILEP